MKTVITATIALLLASASFAQAEFAFSVTLNNGATNVPSQTSVIVVDLDGDGLDGTSYITDDSKSKAETYQWDADDSVEVIETTAGNPLAFGANSDVASGLDWFVIAFESEGGAGVSDGPGANNNYRVYGPDNFDEFSGNFSPDVFGYAPTAPDGGSADIFVAPEGLGSPGNDAPVLTTVPEPASAMLIGLGGLALLARRRRA